MISPGTVEHLDFLRNVFQEEEDLMTSDFKFQKLEELPVGSYQEDVVLNLNIRRQHKKCTEMTVSYCSQRSTGIQAQCTLDKQCCVTYKRETVTPKLELWPVRRA